MIKIYEVSPFSGAVYETPMPGGNANDYHLGLFGEVMCYKYNNIMLNRGANVLQLDANDYHLGFLLVSKY